jgi:hypothetical protein
MATRKATTRRPDRARLETSPERVALICNTLNGLCDADYRVLDALGDEKSLRALAERLRLPYLQVQLTGAGVAGLTEADVDEYNAWRAALSRKAGAEA